MTTPVPVSEVRVMATFRTSPTSWRYITATAGRRGVTRSRQVRDLLALGIKAAPKEWT